LPNEGELVIARGRAQVEADVGPLWFFTALFGSLAGPTAPIGQVDSSHQYQVEEAGILTILSQEVVATISVTAVFGLAISALTL
jgi:hypothetical protein